MPVRSYRHSLFVVVLFCFCHSGVIAQELRKVSAAEAQIHLQQGGKPKYPPVAQMARIQGDVIMTATITETGAVQNLKLVSGHPILAQAALDAVRLYQYQPFLEGNQPVPVQATIKVGFVMGESPLEPEFQQASTACQLAIERQQLAEGEQPCSRAAAIAEKLPEGYDRYRFTAFGNAGMVATKLNKAEDAARYFEQQVHLAEKSRQFSGSPATSSLNARLNLARAYTASGQIQKADSAYVAAEKAIRSSQKELRSGNLQVSPREAAERMSQTLKQQLKQTLEQHAALLRQMGKSSEADQLEQQAGSVNY